MLSILSGILGFATSGLPSVLKFFEQKGDQNHEREMAKLQTERELELAKAGFVSQEKIEAIKLESKPPERRTPKGTSVIICLLTALTNSLRTL